MTAFTSATRNGPPLSGKFAQGDTFTDASSIAYECMKGGYPGTWILSGPVHVAQKTAVDVGAVASASYVSVVEYGAGGIHQSVLTVAALPLTVPNADPNLQGIGAKIYDFPEGRILILGATAAIAETTTSAILGTLNGGSTCKFGVGSTIGVNKTLATTEQDIVPVTSILSSTVINTAAATAKASLAASAQFDGTATALDAFLNFSVPTDGDLDADATITLSGTIEITWVLLGDY